MCFSEGEACLRLSVPLLLSLLLACLRLPVPLMLSLLLACLRLPVPLLLLFLCFSEGEACLRLSVPLVLRECVRERVRGGWGRSGQPSATLALGSAYPARGQ